jgi:hypothetical protein
MVASPRLKSIIKKVKVTDQIPIYGSHLFLFPQTHYLSSPKGSFLKQMSLASENMGYGSANHSDQRKNM